MRKLILSTVLFALAGSLAMANPRQDEERHDHGKHKGWEKHEDDREEHHDNGKHKGWYKHDRDDYRDWDYDHDRMVSGRRYPHGRYEHVREVFVVRSMDYRTRRVILYDRSNWVVASYDVERCHDWQWDRDRVYVYDDDHHPGWYLLFNARLGRSVHVEFSGVN
jgi:hypothetical protein